MFNTRIVYLVILPVLASTSIRSQQVTAKEPADLRVELRSATGSNRFQLKEVVPLEVLVSSTAPNRYIEPCNMFWESCFGFPQCRFFTHWSIHVTPASGWTDIGPRACEVSGGPVMDVESRDLTAEPIKYTYTLTNKVRFDTPGKYTVRLSITVGLDDDTNQLRKDPNSTIKPKFVTKTAEIVLDIVPASDH